MSIQNCRAAEYPISLITANGSTEANEVADVKLSALPDRVQPYYVLDQTPAVLSVGTIFRDAIIEDIQQFFQIEAGPRFPVAKSVSNRSNWLKRPIH